MQSSRAIDINCDMGEGMAADDQLLPFISSANIACGYHAGDANILRHTIEGCLRHGVAVGAHPSFADRANFGRVDLYGKTIFETDIHNLVAAQLEAVQTCCRSLGASLHHVKPHGALYNRAAIDLSLARAIAAAVASFNPALFLYGPPNSRLQEAAAGYQLKYVCEAFADRTYQADGTLLPRTFAGALLHTDADMLAQVKELLFQQGVKSHPSGAWVPLPAATICLHSDGILAVSFARSLHHFLTENQVAIETVH